MKSILLIFTLILPFYSHGEGPRAIYSFDQKMQILSAAANQLLAKDGDQIGSIDQRKSRETEGFYFQSATGRQCSGWIDERQIGKCVMQQIFEFYCKSTAGTFRGGKRYKMVDRTEAPYSRCPSRPLKSPVPLDPNGCAYFSFAHTYCGYP